MRVVPGTKIGKRYEVVQQLGRGGMGTVWRARDTKLATDVALKVAFVSPDSGYGEARARFAREARIGAKLGQQQGFVRALDWGEKPDIGMLYLALHLVPSARPLDLSGGPLNARLRGLEKAADLVGRVHALEIIHRDIKPENFLVAPDGKIFLSDFGLAKAIHESEQLVETEETMMQLRTLPNMAMGTPAFMPPEQFKDSGSADYRCDVYALGVMLFFCLTGKFPYNGVSAVEVLASQMEVQFKGGKAPTPKDVNSLVDERLNRLCCAAISLDPSKRPPTGEAFARALRPRKRSKPPPGRGRPTARRPSSERPPAPAPTDNDTQVTRVAGAPEVDSAFQPTVIRRPAQPPQATMAVRGRPTRRRRLPKRSDLGLDENGFTDKKALWDLHVAREAEGFKALLGPVVALRVQAERPIEGVDGSEFVDRFTFLLHRNPSEPGPVTLGRARGTDITVPLSTISKLQLEFVRRDGSWHVVEKGSRNGTKLNEVTLPEGRLHALEDGAVICISEHLFVEVLTPASLSTYLVENREGTGEVLGKDWEFETGGIGGTLGQDELVEFFQMVEFNKKTGVLRFRANETDGELVFQAGRLRGAKASGGLKDRLAMHVLLVGGTGCKFSFSPKIPEGFAPTADESVSALLFNALKIKDESRPGS